MTFVRDHAQGILACDFFVTVTASSRLLYVLMMDVGTRRIVHFNVHRSPHGGLDTSTVFGKSSRKTNLNGFSFTTVTAYTLPHSTLPWKRWA
jgi:hypothetical protein